MSKRLAPSVKGILQASVLFFACAGLPAVSAAAGDRSPQDPLHAKINWRQFEGTTINVIHQESFLMDKVLEMRPEFEKLTGIKVKNEPYSENAMWDKLTLDFTSGAGIYDALQVAPFHVAKYAQNRWVANLSDFINNPSLTDKQWYDYDDFFASLRNSQRLGNYVVGVPLDGFPTNLHYRKDLFEKYGVKVPGTMEELEQAAHKLNKLDTDGDGQPDVWGIGLRGSWYQFDLQAFIYTAGGGYVSEGGKSLLLDPKTIAGADKYVQLLRNYAPPGYATKTWPEMLEDWRGGKLAMVIDALVWTVQYEDPAKSRIVGKVGIAPVPGWRPGEKGEPGFWAFGLGVSSASKKQKPAWLWVQWSTAKLQSLKLSKIRQATSRTWVSEHPEWQHVVQPLLGGSWLKLYKEELPRANANYHLSMIGNRAFPEGDEVLNRVGIEIQAAIAGQKTTEQALRDADKAVSSILKKYQ